MKWIPWISREHHDDVVRAKDELIRALQVQIAILDARLNQPVKVTVEMPALPAAPPASIPVGKEEIARAKKPKPLKEINYATLDENDPAQMAALAMQEFGHIPAPLVLGRWYNMVRMECVYGRKQRKAQAEQTGRVGTIEVESAEPETIVEKAPAPQDILDLIAAAERGS